MATSTRASLSPRPPTTGSSQPISYGIRYRDGNPVVKGDGKPAFTFIVNDAAHLEQLLRASAYSSAISFVRGEFDIEGDMVAAIRFKFANGRRWTDLLASALAQLAPTRVESWFQTHRRAATNIAFHYDRSNEFYRAFLDSQMVYSCAYFSEAHLDIDSAQMSKLDHICRKLDLQPNDRFLDVGSGWGALVVHAAEKYGAVALGCTLSFEQAKYSRELIAERQLCARAAIQQLDYRQLRGPFRKIASVGMFEHVGRRRLQKYFRHICEMLDDDGLFLNHGILRPVGVKDGPETLFLQREVFPGGELANLPTTIRAAEIAGFEILDVENLRPHYALTCRQWVERLQNHKAMCLTTVDERTYRTWLLYLAGSALSFETGATDICQILMTKRKGSHVRHLTREYMYPLTEQVS